jgi:hypothetical protein
VGWVGGWGLMGGVGVVVVVVGVVLVAVVVGLLCLSVDWLTVGFSRVGVPWGWGCAARFAYERHRGSRAS